MTVPMVDNTKVLPEGQITIPKDIRDYLNINVGDRLTMICEADRLVLMNSAMFALNEVQKSMANEAEKAELYSDEDVVNLIMEMRYGEKT